MKRHACAMAAMAVSAMPLLAETFEVSYSPTNRTYASGDVISAVTEAVPASLPEVGSTPIFHFDASRPDSWTFNEDGTTVKCIPSLVGGRYLFTEGGRTFADLAGAWDGNKDTWTVEEPEFVASDPVLGMPCLDFGVAGSCRAMLFDNEHVEEGDAVATNILEGIGTVVAVWNSENGGGQLLGGGVAKVGNAWNVGQLWSRGASLTNSAATSALQPSGSGAYMYSLFDWTSPVVCFRGGDVGIIGTSGGHNGNQSALDSAILGVVRHDGADNIPWRSGFNGGWEVVSLVLTNAAGNAHGLGLGTLFKNASSLSGGMKVGEMIVYPEVLSVFDLAKVENYLQNKWFGRPARGTGGNAYLQGAFAPRTETKNGSTTTFDVPAGENLTVGEVPFGRGHGAQIVKTGAGKLTLGDVRGYPGKVVVSGGTLVLGAKALPKSLPGSLLFHINASDASSMTLVENYGTNFVERIASDADMKWRGDSLAAVWQSERKCPFLREGIFPDVGGKPSPVLDFYPIPGNTAATAGGFLRIAKASNSSFVTLSGVTTLAAVYAPRGTGGTIVGNNSAAYSSTGCYFDRGQLYNAWCTYSQPILGKNTFPRIHPTLAPTNGIVMIDGVRRDPSLGFPHPGFQVVVIQVPASEVCAIGSTYNKDHGGGFMLAELALWNRSLTIEEMEDASAYLSAKWFHKPTPGYGRGEGDVYDVQKLELDGDASIEVPDGLTARVGSLTISDGGGLAKTGGGTLEIVNVATQTFSNVRVAAGGIRYVGLPTTASQTDYAKGSSLHLDASDSNTVYRADPTTTQVTYWFDKHHRNFGQIASSYPTYRVTTKLPPTGLPTIDFGAFRSRIYMHFNEALYGVRSAYVVHACSAAGGQGGMLLGSKESSSAPNFRDFYYHQNVSGYPNGPVWNNTSSPYMCCDPSTKIYTNGVVATREALYPTNASEFVLYELHLPAGAHVSGLCEWRGASAPDNYTGGGQYGEILLYERELTDREKVATRNYLMKKWLGTADEDLAPLPDDHTEVMPEMAFGDLSVEDGDDFAVEPETPVVANYLSGEGVFTKSGEGVLSIGDVVGFTGTVAVAEGLLKITSTRPSLEPCLPAPENRLMHVDASRGLHVASFNNDGSYKRIMGWENLADSGWTVTNKSSSAAAHPYAYADNTLGGRTVVRFNQSATTGLKFVNPDGVQTNMYGIKSGLFILGAHEGGGFLLGGGEISNATTGAISVKDCFHRGESTYGDRYTDKLLYIGACDAARTAEYWVNVNDYMYGWSGSTAPKPTDHSFYNNAWNSVAFRFMASYGRIEAVGGFAYCNTVPDRNGSQRLAEVVLYDKRLTDDELASGQAYLRIKWGLDAYQRSMTNHVSVVVADGAALDLGGGEQYFESISGAGVVSNGTLSVSKLVADPLSAPPSLDGTFSASEGIEVEISNFSSVGDSLRIPVLECGSVDNAELLRTAEFTGDLSWTGMYKAKLVYADGVVYVQFKPRGMILIVK